jgi:hypothetical protein
MSVPFTCVPCCFSSLSSDGHKLPIDDYKFPKMKNVDGQNCPYGNPHCSGDTTKGALVANLNKMCVGRQYKNTDLHHTILCGAPTDPRYCFGCVSTQDESNEIVDKIRALIGKYN